MHRRFVWRDLRPAHPTTLNAAVRLDQRDLLTAYEYMARNSPVSLKEGRGAGILGLK